jgi:hypothetical protein
MLIKPFSKWFTMLAYYGRSGRLETQPCQGEQNLKVDIKDPIVLVNDVKAFSRLWVNWASDKIQKRSLETNFQIMQKVM